MNAGAGPWGTPVMGGPAAGGMMVTGQVAIDRAKVVGKIGPGFQGFSYEKTHLTNASFTGSNASLIALFKLIGPVVIRIGANDVERCTWTAATPFANGGQPSGQPFGHVIGSVMVDGLNDLLKASGASVIYGVNYSLNMPANDAAEAAYVAPKLGASLIGFEIGNELDKYGAWAGERAQWESIATAIAGAVPNATFVGMAATAGGAGSHNVPFAMQESAKFGNKLVLLTQHYYIGGAGTGGVGVMQNVSGGVINMATTMDGAATGNRIPMGYRFGEANSFFGHGQPGLSDALIEGLWGIDLEFTIALHGAGGINYHGGETGMDGTKPFTYTPILEANGAVTGTQPAFDASLFVYLAGQGNLLTTNVTTTNPNFTAYAVDYAADGSTMVVLNNKNATTGVQATVDVGVAAGSASAIYLEGTPAGSLTAPAASVTLAGASVTAQGTWARKPPFTQTTAGNTATVFVPPATAALVRIK